MARRCNPTGQWWWLIVGISRELGLTNAHLRKVKGREDIAHEIDDDIHGGWTTLDPLEATGRARREFERIHPALWTQVYVDHYRAICHQYARFQDAIDGIRAPEPYP